MAESARAQMKHAMGDLIWIVVMHTALVAQLVKGIALLPRPQTSVASTSLAHDYQRMTVLNDCMLLTTFVAAFLAINVRGLLSTATKEERMLRVSVLLALALLPWATHFYVLQVRMATVFSSRSGAAKATLWAFYAVAGLACAFCHYHLAALAVSSEYEKTLLLVELVGFSMHS